MRWSDIEDLQGLGRPQDNADHRRERALDDAIRHTPAREPLGATPQVVHLADRPRILRQRLEAAVKEIQAWRARAIAAEYEAARLRSRLAQLGDHRG